MPGSLEHVAQKCAAVFAATTRSKRMSDCAYALWAVCGLSPPQIRSHFSAAHFLKSEVISGPNHAADLKCCSDPAASHMIRGAVAAGQGGLFAC